MIQSGRRHLVASKRSGAACTGLAERLVGVAVPDFDGAYLDERLATARQALAAHKRA